MADDERPDTEAPGEDEAPKHEHDHGGLGERLHHAEEVVEEALKDTVARIENRVILASEVADQSQSSEVNLLSAIDVALDPPEAGDEKAAENAESPARKGGEEKKAAD